MCFKDMFASLRAEGLDLTPAQIRYAIYNGKVSTPPMNGSLSFDFGPQHIAELLTYFRGRERQRRSRKCVAE